MAFSTKTAALFCMSTFIISFFSLISDCQSSSWQKILSPIPTDTLQLIVVIVPVWNSQRGLIQSFARNSRYDEWTPADRAESVVVGRNGLGWGRGLQHVADIDGPVKKEGDGKAPAGIFYLGAVFGYAEPKKMGRMKMPYLHVDKKSICVDDSDSKYYNHTFDASGVRRPDWTSFENMKRADNLYRLGIVVNHNTESVVKGAGSCIFLHIWRNSSRPTAGCTAMPASSIEKLILWLDSEKKPVLVQLPRPEFEKLHQAWGLPDAK